MASQQQDNRLDDSASRQDEDRQGQPRFSRHSMRLRPRRRQPTSRDTAATSMPPPPSSTPERVSDAQYQLSPVTPETNTQDRVIFDRSATPVNERMDEFLSQPPSPQARAPVWNSPAPSNQGQYFTIWEDPPGYEPAPSSSNPEPQSDIDEDKENIFTFFSNEQTDQSTATRNYPRRIDSQISSFDAFGMPMHIQFSPSFPVHPRESSRLSPEPLFTNPMTQPANLGFRPTTPSIIREDGTGFGENFWGQDIFQARPDRAIRRGNLFYGELRRRRDRLSGIREDENGRDQNGTRTETQDITEFTHQDARAQDSEDEI